MGRLAWASPLMLVFVAAAYAAIESVLDRGPWRLPSAGGIGTAAWYPAIAFILGSDALRTREDRRAGLRLLALSEALLVLTFALINLLFCGTLGAVLGFALAALGMTALGAAVGFIKIGRRPA